MNARERKEGNHHRWVKWVNQLQSTNFPIPPDKNHPPSALPQSHCTGSVQDASTLICICFGKHITSYNLHKKTTSWTPSSWRLNNSILQWVSQFGCLEVRPVPNMNEWMTEYNFLVINFCFTSVFGILLSCHPPPFTHLCARVDPLLRSVWPSPHLRWIYMANLWDEFRVKNGHHWMYLLFMSPCVTLCNEDIVQSGENLWDIKFPNSKYISIEIYRYYIQCTSAWPNPFTHVIQTNFFCAI